MSITLRIDDPRLVQSSTSHHPSVLRWPHPVLPARKLGRRRLVAITLLDRKYVLFRDESGKAAAVVDACPHRGALLSKGSVNQQGELVCAYHGWRIRSDGQAQSAAVATRSCRIPRLRTWERHGYIWIAHEDVLDSAFPEFLRPGYSMVARFPMRFEAPLRVAVDNFSEVEHAFQVHRFIGPGKNQLDTVSMRTEIGDDRTSAVSSAQYRGLPLGLSRFFGIRRGDRYHNDWVFQFQPLFGSYDNYWTSPAGQRRPVRFVVTTFFVPTAGGKATLHTFLQVAIDSPWFRLFRALIYWVSSAIIRYELWADARIARFAPDTTDPRTAGWHLTKLDKQIIANRRLMETLYFQGSRLAPGPLSLLEPESDAVPTATLQRAGGG